MELHILLAGVEFGPYSEDKARQLLDEGFLSASDPAKRLDETAWQPLSELLGASPVGAGVSTSTRGPKISSPATEAPAFRSLATTLEDEEPLEDYHAPLPPGSEVAEAAVGEEPLSVEHADAGTEAPLLEQPATQATAEEVQQPPPPPMVTPGRAEAAVKRPDLTVSRPSVPLFRSTVPITTRPPTTSLPPPRLSPASKTETQSLSKTRRLAQKTAPLPATPGSLKPATEEMKSSFAAALAKTRSVTGSDTAPLPAPTRPEKAAPARATTPLRAASLSATTTAPLTPVAAASRPKKLAVTGSLLAKEALLKAREQTGTLGPRTTVPLAPAADFEPEPPAPRGRTVVRLANRDTGDLPALIRPAQPRKAIRLTGRMSLPGSDPHSDQPNGAKQPPAPPVEDPKVAPPTPIDRAKAPPEPKPDVPEPKTEQGLVKTSRKSIKLTGPISLPGRATEPTRPVPVLPGGVEMAPINSLAVRPAQRPRLGLITAKTVPVAKTPVAAPPRPPVEKTTPAAPPLVHPAEIAAASALAAEVLEEAATRHDPDTPPVSSGSLKITGALKHSPAPRSPIRLNSSLSDSGGLALPGEPAAPKPPAPVPEEELANRAPSGKIPLHEFPTEGVKVRTRRLTSRIPLPGAPGESIASESPARQFPPPLPKKIELPAAPEELAAAEPPADVSTETPVAPEEEATVTEPLPEPEPPPAAERPEPKPDKVRLRRPVKLELSSRKADDSGRLTLEAFSKMASRPATPPAAEPVTGSEATALPETQEAEVATEAPGRPVEFSGRRLEKTPPLVWTPRDKQPPFPLAWIFYSVIGLGIVAAVIVAYLTLHRSSETAEAPASATPETAPAQNESPAPAPATATPPPSAAPPATASVPATAPVPATASVPATTTEATPPPSAAPPAATAVVVPPPATTTNALPAAVPPPISPAQEAARQASAFVSDGILKYQHGDYAGAIAAYNQALTINPTSTEAFFNRGISKAAQDDLDGAIADYSQALQAPPSDPNLGAAYYYRGLARHSKADLDGAISDYNNAVRIDPKNALAFFNRGLIRMQKDDIDGAIVDSTSALELDPRLIQSYYDRGLGRLAKGATDGALADMKQFTQLAPQDPYTDYARLYIWLMETQQGQLAESNKDLGDAMNNSWNGASDSMVTRIGEFLLGQISESDLIKASASSIPVKDQGQRCEAWYFIGMRKLEAGDKDGAADALRKCVDTQKTDYCEYILAQEALKKLEPGVDTTIPAPRAQPAGLPDPGTMVPAPAPPVPH
jgi:lipoprotein NlpI